MKLIDMHCDTIGKIMDLDKKGNLRENFCSVTISEMKRAKSLAQFFACFTYLGDYIDNGGYDACYIHALDMITFLEKQINSNSKDIAFAGSYDEICKNESEGKVSAVVTIEEGGILNNKMERLDNIYDKGVRLITLMWNYENCLGYPNSRDDGIMQKGLKPFGIEVVEQMGKKGMIVDVSHASDGSFWDVMKHAKGPVVASHSNCRSLCNHPRNLSDEMIRALADKGGVAGLNLYGAFLGTEDESRIDEMAAHIVHMINVGGSEFAAIGTDFDGFHGMKVMEIPMLSDMEKLWMYLKRKGVSEGQLEKIWNGNVLRIIKEM